jgi:hypothetical protein
MFGRLRRDRFNSKDMPVLRMDSKVFKLRRRVISIIHDANKIVRLPRINVRVTEQAVGRPKVLGRAHSNQLLIKIPKGTFNMPKETLRYVIYHEIGHAVFKLPHTRRKGLMHPHVQYGTTREQSDRLLRDAVKRK